MSRFKKYTLPVGKEDHGRLMALNGICNPLTLQFLAKSNLSLIGKTVADIGCGTGGMAVEWAKLIGPTGKVIAIDISEEQLALASDYAQSQGIENIDFVCLAVNDLDQLTETVNIVYNRFLLEHLSDPILAIKNMINLIGPNGYIFCESGKSHEAIFSDPNSELIDKVREMMLLHPKFYNTDFAIGKKLYSILS